jgi:hypothetical protein
LARASRKTPDALSENSSHLHVICESIPRPMVTGPCAGLQKRSIHHPPVQLESVPIDSRAISPKSYFTSARARRPPVMRSSQTSTSQSAPEESRTPVYARFGDILVRCVNASIAASKSYPRLVAETAAWEEKGRNAARATSPGASQLKRPAPKWTAPIQSPRQRQAKGEKSKPL